MKRKLLTLSNPVREKLKLPMLKSLVPEIAGSAAPTFTRSSTQTVTDFEGVLCTVKAGEIAVSGARRVENLLTYSEQFDNAAWSKVNITVTPNAATAPDGTMTADKLCETTVTSFFAIVRNPAFSFSTTYTASCFVKPAERTLFFYSFSALGYIAYFNLATGIVSSTTGAITASIIVAEGGWYRVSVTLTTLVSGANQLYQVAGFLLNSGSYAGVVGYGGYIWGAQLENVTGQSVQTVGEYVSTNVLSFPYHGAGANGVKYFDKKLDGSNIPKATTQGVLFEGTGTNLKTNSESFELWNTNASPNGTTVSVNAALSPNGEMTADLIIPVAGYGGHSRYAGFVGAVNTTYTFSVWLKAGGYNYAAISLESSGFPSTSRVLIDLVNGVIITGTYTNTTAYTIFSGKNGWYRVSTQNTSDSDGGPYTPVIEIWTSSNPALFTGDGVSGVYAFGADVKAANFLSSYIATTTAAASRAATVLSYPTLNNIYPNQFTIALEFTPTHTPSGTIYLWGSYVDANNGTYLLHDGTNLILRKRIGGTNYDATIVNPFVANQMYRIVAKSSHNGMNIMLDGKLGAMNSNSTPAQLGTTFEVGSDGQGGNQPFAYIKDLKHYSKALSVSKMSGVSL